MQAHIQFHVVLNEIFSVYDPENFSLTVNRTFDFVDSDFCM